MILSLIFTHFSAFYAIFTILIHLLQIILVAYVYGVDKFLINIAEMKMKLSGVTSLYWKARA